MAYDVPFIKNNTGDGSFTFATLPSGAATSTIPKGVMAYTTDESMCVWTGTAWTPIGAGTTSVAFASGDTTGVKDTSVIQSLLTAARLAGGGTVSGISGSTYYINAPLIIGSGTTISMTGCHIVLVANSNCSMLQNYSQTNSVASGSVSMGVATTTVFCPSASSNPLYLYLTAQTATNAQAWSFVAPMKYGSITTTIFSSITAGGTFGGNSFTVLNKSTATGIPVSVTGNLYLRDKNIRIIGGIWDRGANTFGNSSDYDHNIKIRYCDGVTSTDVVSLMTQTSGGIYALFFQDCTHVYVRRPQYGSNPHSGAWIVSAGFGRDGVHFNGPFNHGYVEGGFGTPGDDGVSVAAADAVNVVGNIVGDVTNVEVVGSHMDPSYQTAVKLYGGPENTISKVKVSNIFGQSSSSGGNIVMGDASNISSALVGCTYDQITFEDIYATVPTAAPLVWIGGTNLGRIKMRRLFYDNSSGTNLGVVEIGTASAFGSSQSTTIAELSIDDLVIKGLGGSTAPIYGPSVTITELKTSGMSKAATNFPLCAFSSATIGYWDMKDHINAINLTAQTASIGSTSALVIPTGGSGLYKIFVDLQTTTAGNAVTVLASIITNNGNATLTQTTNTIAAQTLGSEVSTVFVAYLSAGQNINYSTTVSGAIGIGQYSLKIRAEFLG